ncbi:MAG: epoxyqueuosine reductase QueH [Candidatus Magasanikbacteria bacterium]
MKKFLLHVCCGPCSVVVLQELKEQYDLTVHFYNPNIYPFEEYEKRKIEVINLCTELGIPFVEQEYDPEVWFEATQFLKDEPEGGKRCEACFKLRLAAAAQYAAEHKFNVFSTTITSGRYKKASIVNPIGKEVGEKFGVEYYTEDWKKGGRQQEADMLAKEKGIYRQDYCGCVYSMH